MPKSSTWKDFKYLKVPPYVVSSSYNTNTKNAPTIHWLCIFFLEQVFHLLSLSISFCTFSTQEWDLSLHTTNHDFPIATFISKILYHWETLINSIHTMWKYFTLCTIGITSPTDNIRSITLINIITLTHIRRSCVHVHGLTKSLMSMEY